MSILLNILWLFFGGFASAMAWFVASIIMALTIIGLPWARACFNIALLHLWPFGARSLSRELTTGEDLGTGPLGVIGNVIWFLFAGWWLFISHFICAALCAITIIGIPFAIQFWKLAKLSLFPVGQQIHWKS